MTTPTIWTAARVNKLKRLWEDDVSMMGMARQLGVTEWSVRRALTVNGLVARTKGPKDRVWTDAKTKKLREMWGDRRLTVADIAVRLNMTAYAVKSKAGTLGLSRRNGFLLAASEAPIKGCDPQPPHKDPEHVANLIAAGGFPVLSEQLVSDHGGVRKFKCVLPMFYPVRRAA